MQVGTASGGCAPAAAGRPATSAVITPTQALPPRRECSGACLLRQVVMLALRSQLCPQP